MPNTYPTGNFTNALGDKSQDQLELVNALQPVIDVGSDPSMPAPRSPHAWTGRIADAPLGSEYQVLQVVPRGRPLRIRRLSIWRFDTFNPQTGAHGVVPLDFDATNGITLTDSGAATLYDLYDDVTCRAAVGWWTTTNNLADGILPFWGGGNNRGYYPVVVEPEIYVPMGRKFYWQSRNIGIHFACRMEILEAFPQDMGPR